MKIKIKKKISLDKFINQSLYNKISGYYMKKNPFGKKGDFITSPNISILFSEMISIWIIALWKKLKKPKKFNIVELGAGNGEMMFNIIKTSNQFSFFKNSCNFFIFEKSIYLKKIQKNKLKNFDVNWLSNLKQINNFPTIFIGNEFFDSFPVKQFIKKNNKWFEKYVEISSESKKFINKEIDIKKIEKKIGINLEKKQKFIEFSPLIFQTIKKISKIINRKNGGLLIIDYGYFDNKMFNTLQAVKKHKKTDILKDAGNADITHLLNYKIIEKIAKKFKLKVNGLCTQRNFLIKLGIIKRAEIISKNVTFSEKANIYYRLKRLIDNNQMGEIFKVMFVSNKKINFNLGF
tara:strand:- start:758 stop:1801 length:1044 start_codon:yes stop_codon:yes gene_type:complete